MSSGGTPPKQKQLRDKQRASYMKSIGETRTTGRCAACLQIVPTDSAKSKYRHVCPGGPPSR